MRTYLVEASPRDPATGAIIPTRLAGGGSKPYMWLGFNDWRAGVMGLPRFTTELDFGDAGWTGGAIPQTAAINFMSADTQLVSELARLYWKDAPLTIRVGDDAPAVPTFSVLLEAIVAAIEVSDGALTLTIADLGTKLNKPIIADTFKGTGGVEGDATTSGRLKRRSFGLAFNVEGFILDPANLIYEFGDPAKPLTDILAVMDRGRAGALNRVEWQGSIDATFAALQVAAAPQGGGVIAPSIACAKWWTTASGPLTAKISGEYYADIPGTAPGIAKLFARFADLTIVNYDFASAIRPAVVGIHCDDSSETIAGAMDRLLVGSSLLWVLDPDGSIRLEQWSLDASTYSIPWSGTANAPDTWDPATVPPIAWEETDPDVEEITSKSVARRAIYSPIKTRDLGYQANNRVMNDGEVSAALLITDVYYADGTTAASIISQALTDAANAQATADGKIETFLQNDAPVGASEGDLWFDTNDGNKQYRFTSGNWLAAQDQAIGTAIVSAAGAQATADGKVTTFVGASPPTAISFGDLWVNTAQGNALFRWNNSYWELVQDLGALGGQNGLNTDGMVKPDKVVTGAIQLNNVTQALRWSASYSGGADSTVVIPSGSTFGTFGLSGNPAQTSITVDVAGAEVTVHWNVNAERTGSKDDRVSYRLRRTDGGGNVVYIGDVLPAGMGDSPTTINWLWDDTGLAIGTYTYAMEAASLVGGGTFYSAKLIAEAGYR